MAFFDKIIKKLPFLSTDGSINSFMSPFGNGNGHQNNGTHQNRKKKYSNLIMDKDPTLVWEIVNEIGDGAFGKVYKARNKTNGIYAAAKIVEKCSQDELDDYMIEIDILSECKHKNIVEIYESYYYDSKLWMLIEFCSGGAVDTLMFDLDKPLTEPQIQYVIRETLEALVYLHENCHVIHRDMKAGNILLTESGLVKLADFGVSAKNTTLLQRRYSFIGTPYWMSPEVIACETDKEISYDYKADIWSLGITCIELAEKEPPHNELNPTRVMMRIRKSDAPKLKETHKWSKVFQDFLSKCLTKMPDERLNARELLKHPFISKFDGDEKVIKILLIEKNATVNVIEEIETDENNSSSNNNLGVKPIDSTNHANLNENNNMNKANNSSFDSSVPTSSSSAHGNDSEHELSFDATASISNQNNLPNNETKTNNNNNNNFDITNDTQIESKSLKEETKNLSNTNNSEENNVVNNNQVSTNIMNRNSVKHVKPLAPPPPPPIHKILTIDQSINSSSKSYTAPVPQPSVSSKTEIINHKIDNSNIERNKNNESNKINTENDNSNHFIEKLSDEVLEEICLEVIKCDDRAPSVPDVILQVISEILNESNEDENNTPKPVIDKDKNEQSDEQSEQNNNLKTLEPQVATTITTNNNPKPYQIASIMSNYASTNTISNENDSGVQTTLSVTTASTVSSISSPSKTNKSSVKSSNDEPSIKNNDHKDTHSKDSKLTNNSDNSSSNNSSISIQNKLNRNRTRKTITKTFVVDGQTVTQTIKKTVNPEEEERQRQLIEDRKRDLAEHKRNLNEDRRKLIEQTRKQENEKEALEQDFREQREKLLKEFEIKLSQIQSFRKSEIERCEEAQMVELKTTLKRLKNEQEKALKYQREQLKEEFKLFKKELESNSNQMLMPKEHREIIKKQKEKELIKRVIF
jgi:serine/threonine protein kinase